jgi:hypothetical protein
MQFYPAVALRQCTGAGLHGHYHYTAAGCTSPVIQTLAPLCGPWLRVVVVSRSNGLPSPVLEGNRSIGSCDTRDGWPTGLFWGCFHSWVSRPRTVCGWLEPCTIHFLTLGATTPPGVVALPAGDWAASAGWQGFHVWRSTLNAPWLADLTVRWQTLESPVLPLAWGGILQDAGGDPLPCPSGLLLS